jgi:hypothetical protein
MEPEDRVLEMKRLETIADRNKTRHASGGIAGQLHLNRPGYQTGAMVNKPVAETKAVTTAAPERKLPFENYYVGPNPTADQAAFMQEHGAAPLGQRQKVLERIQKMNPAGTGNIIQGIKDFGKHATVSEAMAGKTGLGVIPEYGMQTGYDFQTKMAGLDPKISAGLAAAYQTLQEGSRALNPFGDTFLRFPTAMKTAQKQATENIEGILAADTGTLTAEQLANRNKFLASQGQPTETMTATPTKAAISTAASTAPDKETFEQYKARMLADFRRSHAGQKTATTDLTPTGEYTGVTKEIPIEDYFAGMIAQMDKDPAAYGFASGGRVSLSKGGLAHVLGV